MEDILEGVYGASLLNAGFPDVRGPWEARRLKGSRKIRERFEATDVLVPSPWTLQLPEVARSHALVLYHIPENGEFASGLRSYSSKFGPGNSTVLKPANGR
jgi:hypothetical protein